MSKPKVYISIIEEIFKSKFKEGMTQVDFKRSDIAAVAKRLSIPVPSNVGDVVYSARYRKNLPKSVQSTALRGYEWIIRGRGSWRYSFVQTRQIRLAPNNQMAVTEIPDATPGIVAMHMLNDEQALLAVMRYNRLIDTFIGITCYSLQNHLRTALRGIGQVETDELYVGVDAKGFQYVIPVQVKDRSDELNIVQIEQDFALCASKFPKLVCRPVAAQLMHNDVVALFAFEKVDGEIKIFMERHYKLVKTKKCSYSDLFSET